MVWRASRPLLLAVCLLLVWPTGRAGLPDLYRLEIVATHPHDTGAFTQGLLFYDGALLESTGLKGHSSLRQVSVESGEVVRRVNLEDRYFGEGLARVGDRLVMLTYTAGQGLVFDLETFDIVDRFEYEGQGWGLAFDGERLYMSDSSHVLRILDPETLTPVGRLPVTIDNQPLPRINELEFIEGELWANVWPTDWIVVIDPDSGVVTRRIDASALKRALPAGYRVDVLNGIAYDAGTKRIFATGKRWPKLFEVRVVGPLPAP